jgi:hypothetical protein
VYHETCITIIDTIILTNYTNDAYIYDTHLSGASQPVVSAGVEAGRCDIKIGVGSVYMQYNCVYYCDTC